MLCVCCDVGGGTQGDIISAIKVEGGRQWTHLSAALWWRGLEAAARARRLLSEPTNPLSVSGETTPSYRKEKLCNINIVCHTGSFVE